MSEDTIQLLQIILGILSTFGIPLVLGYIKEKSQLNDWVKFGLAAAASLVVGTLQAAIDGRIGSNYSIAYNATAVFTASQIAFTAFRGLGLEAKLFPKTGLIQEAKAQVETELKQIEVAKAKDLLDPTTPRSLIVTTKTMILDDLTKR